MNEAILVLKDELCNGNLTEQEYNDYINLFRFAADKIFEKEKHSEFREEVDRMTKPLIELPSVREKRLRAEIETLRAENAEKDAELAQMKELLNKKEFTAFWIKN